MSRLVENVENHIRRLYRQIFNVTNREFPLLMSFLDAKSRRLYLEFYTVHGTVRDFIFFLYMIKKLLAVHVTTVVRRDRVMWSLGECERVCKLHGVKFEVVDNGLVFVLD